MIDPEIGGRGLFDPRLPPPFDLGLEAQRLDRLGVGHGLGEGGGLGSERLEILVGEAPLRTMGGERHADQHRDGCRSDQPQGGAYGARRRQEQRHEGEIDRQRRHLAGEEAA